MTKHGKAPLSISDAVSYVLALLFLYFIHLRVLEIEMISQSIRKMLIYSRLYAFVIVHVQV